MIPFGIFSYKANRHGTEFCKEMVFPQIGDLRHGLFAGFIFTIIQYVVEKGTFKFFWDNCKEQKDLVMRKKRAEKAAAYFFKGCFYTLIGVYEVRLAFYHQWLPKYFIGGWFYPEKLPNQYEVDNACIDHDPSTRLYY